MIRPFAYVRPLSVEEALAALQEENSRPLAGGSDLLVDMRGGLKAPSLLVDIKAVDELRRFTVEGDEGVAIGAAVPLNELVNNSRLQEACPSIGEAAFSIATYQIRNRATLVGNLCNASPAADMAPPLYVLGAEVVIAGPGGERRLSVQELITGVKQTALQPGELVLRVEIPELPRGRNAFLKKMRVRGHDVSTINVAGLADRESGTLRICVGSCAPTPLLLEGTDRLWEENGDVEKLAKRAAELAERAISPIDDVRSSEEYRRDMVRVFVKRLIRKICTE